MFYQVSINNEWANAEPLLLEETYDEVPRAAGRNIFVNWSTHNLIFSLCFHLKTPYLTSSVDLLTLKPRPILSTITPIWTKLIQHIHFSPQGSQPSWAWNTKHHLSINIRCHFTQQNHQQKTQNTVPLSRPRKGHWQNESWNKWADHCFPQAQLGMCASGNSNFCHSTYVHMTVTAPQALIWGLQ